MALIRRNQSNPTFASPSFLQNAHSSSRRIHIRNICCHQTVVYSIVFVTFFLFQFSNRHIFIRLVFVVASHVIFSFVVHLFGFGLCVICVSSVAFHFLFHSGPLNFVPAQYSAIPSRKQTTTTKNPGS